MKHKNYPPSTLLEIFRYGRMGKYLSIFLVLAFLNTLGGCYYYKIVASEDPYPEVISIQQDEEKYFILHIEDQAWNFTDISVKDDTVEGKITPLLGHEYYKTKNTDYANRYKVSKSQEKDESEVINEVHITVSEYSAAEGNEITISTKNIEKIEIYDKDKGANATSMVLSVIGITLGIIVLNLVLLFLN